MRPDVALAFDRMAALRVAAHDFAASSGTVEGDRHQLAEEDALHQAARDLVDLLDVLARGHLPEGWTRIEEGSSR